MKMPGQVHGARPGDSLVGEEQRTTGALHHALLFQQLDHRVVDRHAGQAVHRFARDSQSHEGRVQGFDPVS
jgi:hypothetical protein